MIRLFFNWLINALAALLTLGLVASVRRRLLVNHSLLRWHFLGQPASWGIPR